MNNEFAKAIEKYLGNSDQNESALKVIVDAYVSTIICKPWGFYRDSYRSTETVNKLIFVKPHSKLSLQRHQYRSEVWTIIYGKPDVIIEKERHQMKAGDIAFISRNETHRIENNTDEYIIINEIQTGECDENDIIRIEDDYGRVG